MRSRALTANYTNDSLSVRSFRCRGSVDRLLCTAPFPPNVLTLKSRLSEVNNGVLVTTILGFHLDPENEEIWIDSPAEQARIQRPGSLTKEGDVGAQQIMVNGREVPLLGFPISSALSGSVPRAS